MAYSERGSIWFVCWNNQPTWRHNSERGCIRFICLLFVHWFLLCVCVIASLISHTIFQYGILCYCISFCVVVYRSVCILFFLCVCVCLLHSSLFTSQINLSYLQQLETTTAHYHESNLNRLWAKVAYISNSCKSISLLWAKKTNRILVPLVLN